LIAGPRKGQTGNRPDKKDVHQGEMDYPRGPALLFVKTIRFANSFSTPPLILSLYTSQENHSKLGPLLYEMIS